MKECISDKLVKFLKYCSLCGSTDIKLKARNLLKEYKQEEIKLIFYPVIYDMNFFRERNYLLKKDYKTFMKKLVDPVALDYLKENFDNMLDILDILAELVRNVSDDERYNKNL